MTGEEFKRARIRQGLTQKKIGIMLGYKEASAERIVQHWEYDEQPIPIKHFRTLAKILDVPLEKFIP